MVADTNVTRMRTKFRFAGALLVPLPDGLALGAQQAKLDADIRTSSSIGTPSIQFVHDYHYLFALKDAESVARTMKVVCTAVYICPYPSIP
jgi:hypothetical protein